MRHVFSLNMRSFRTLHVVFQMELVPLLLYVQLGQSVTQSEPGQLDLPKPSGSQACNNQLWIRWTWVCKIRYLRLIRKGCSGVQCSLG